MLQPAGLACNGCVLLKGCSCYLPGLDRHSGRFACLVPHSVRVKKARVSMASLPGNKI